MRPTVLRRWYVPLAAMERLTVTLHDPPEELRAGGRPGRPPELNRLERLIYGWLNRPHLMPRIGKWGKAK